MKIEDILDRKNDDIITIDISHNLRAAADLMMLKRIAALVVTEKENPVALLSERDLTNALAEHGARAAETPIRSVLPDTMVTISPEETLKRAMVFMTRNRVRHLPVVRAKEMIGVVSLGDLVKFRLEEMDLESNVLRDLAIAAR